MTHRFHDHEAYIDLDDSEILYQTEHDTEKGPSDGL